jgi:hypothetical protein
LLAIDSTALLHLSSIGPALTVPDLCEVAANLSSSTPSSALPVAEHKERSDTRIVGDGPLCLKSGCALYLTCATLMLE